MNGYFKIIRVFSYIVAAVSMIWMLGAFGAMVLWGHALFFEPNQYIATGEFGLVVAGIWALAMITILDFYPKILRDEPEQQVIKKSGSFDILWEIEQRKYKYSECTKGRCE